MSDVCANCGWPVARSYDDDDRWWVHVWTGDPYCQRPTFATPATP